LGNLQRKVGGKAFREVRGGTNMLRCRRWRRSRPGGDDLESYRRLELKYGTIEPKMKSSHRGNQKGKKVCGAVYGGMKGAKKASTGSGEKNMDLDPPTKGGK